MVHLLLHLFVFELDHNPVLIGLFHIQCINLSV